MGLFKKKVKIVIGKQKPWVVTRFEPVFVDCNGADSGYIELEHRQTQQCIRKEIAWLKGEGAYEEKGYRPPTLLDIWGMFQKSTPGTTGFSYNNWHIKRDQGCFIYVLVGMDGGLPYERYKNIVSDHTCKQQDFIGFIDMLDTIQEYQDDTGSRPIINLDEMRLKKEKLA